MEKRSVRLTINGVVCPLITSETDRYMRKLAEEVEELTSSILSSSPYVTREMAALTAALSFCDELKKCEQREKELYRKLMEIQNGSQSAATVSIPPPSAQPAGSEAYTGEPAGEADKVKIYVKPLKNPMKHSEDFEKEGFVDFYEKKV